MYMHTKHIFVYVCTDFMQMVSFFLSPSCHWIFTQACQLYICLLAQARAGLGSIEHNYYLTRLCQQNGGEKTQFNWMLLILKSETGLALWLPTSSSAHAIRYSFLSSPCHWHILLLCQCWKCSSNATWQQTTQTTIYRNNMKNWSGEKYCATLLHPFSLNIRMIDPKMRVRVLADSCEATTQE